MFLISFPFVVHHIATTASQKHQLWSKLVNQDDRITFKTKAIMRTLAIDGNQVYGCI